MKKRIFMYSVALILALSGCGKSEGATKTEETIESVTEATKETTTEAITEASTQATTEAYSSDSGDDAHIIKLELKETDNLYISELMNESGVYIDSLGNEAQYHYQIPQFNVNSESAMSLNKRITDDLYNIIAMEYEEMNRGTSLLNFNITYNVVEFEKIVAIIATVPYPGDTKLYFAYTYDFDNNKEITNAELLAMNNMSEQEFVEKACKMGEEYFIDQASIMGITDEEELNRYMEGAKEKTTINLPMYYDENGVLNVYVPFPSAAGASYYYHLCQF